MSETIVVEAVSDKFKNKYSAGSIKANGKWMQVSSKLDLKLFPKNGQIEVETTTNDKGYTTVTKVLEGIKKEDKEPETKTEPKVVSYEDNKNRRILVQGIVQAVVQSPATINFGDDVNQIAAKVKELAINLINFVDNQI